MDPTPAIVPLTKSDVENIRRTWAIPAANVSDVKVDIFLNLGRVTAFFTAKLVFLRFS